MIRRRRGIPARRPLKLPQWQSSGTASHRTQTIFTTETRRPQRKPFVVSCERFKGMLTQSHKGTKEATDRRNRRSGHSGRVDCVHRLSHASDERRATIPSDSERTTGHGPHGGPLLCDLCASVVNPLPGAPPSDGVFRPVFHCRGMPHRERCSVRLTRHRYDTSLKRKRRADPDFPPDPTPPPTRSGPSYLRPQRLQCTTPATI